MKPSERPKRLYLCLRSACRLSSAPPLLEAILKPLRASRGPFRNLLGLLLGFLEASWDLLGIYWGAAGGLRVLPMAEGSKSQFVFPLVPFTSIVPFPQSHPFPGVLSRIAHNIVISSHKTSGEVRGVLPPPLAALRLALCLFCLFSNGATKQRVR